AEGTVVRIAASELGQLHVMLITVRCNTQQKGQRALPMLNVTKWRGYGLDDSHLELSAVPVERVPVVIEVCIPGELMKLDGALLISITEHCARLTWGRRHAGATRQP